MENFHSMKQTHIQKLKSLKNKITTNLNLLFIILFMSYISSLNVKGEYPDITGTAVMSFPRQQTRSPLFSLRGQKDVAVLIKGTETYIGMNTS